MGYVSLVWLLGWRLAGCASSISNTKCFFTFSSDLYTISRTCINANHGAVAFTTIMIRGRATLLAIYVMIHQGNIFTCGSKRHERATFWPKVSCYCSLYTSHVCHSQHLNRTVDGNCTKCLVKCILFKQQTQPTRFALPSAVTRPRSEYP